MISSEVVEVGRDNLIKELENLRRLRQRCNRVFIDTEFPGFIHNTPRFASEEDRYRDLKRNVDSMKLIQLGVALCDEDGFACYSWQFDLSDFDVEADLQSKASIEFLKKNGMDFGKVREKGVEARTLSGRLVDALVDGCRGTKWITYHGLYDLAYFLKLLLQKPLPHKLSVFLGMVRELFGGVVDIKYVLKSVDAGFDKMGLVKVAQWLGIDWKGNSHQGGRDSFLTAMVYWEMRRRFGDFAEIEFGGLLYGVEREGVKQKKKKMQALLNASQDRRGCPVVSASDNEIKERSHRS